MADIEFNRSAVGINAKKDWEDADFFGQIGAQISSAAPGGVALPLPAGPNEGTGNISFLIKGEDKKHALQSLSAALFN